MRTYEEVWTVLPNTIIVPDQTLEFFHYNKILTNQGKAREDYSGIALKKEKIKIYMLGRLNGTDLEELSNKDSGKSKLHRMGGFIH